MRQAHVAPHLLHVTHALHSPHNYAPQLSVKVVDIYLAALWVSKYPPLFTSTLQLVNNY